MWDGKTSENDSHWAGLLWVLSTYILDFTSLLLLEAVVRESKLLPFLWNILLRKILLQTVFQFQSMHSVSPLIVPLAKRSWLSLELNASNTACCNADRRSNINIIVFFEANVTCLPAPIDAASQTCFWIAHIMSKCLTSDGAQTGRWKKSPQKERPFFSPLSLSYGYNNNPNVNRNE